MLSKEIVLEQVMSRLTHTKIKLGNVFEEPIAPMFKHGEKEWLGIVKLHLKNPLVDGVQLY